MYKQMANRQASKDQHQKFREMSPIDGKELLILLKMAISGEVPKQGGKISSLL